MSEQTISLYVRGAIAAALGGGFTALSGAAIVVPEEIFSQGFWLKAAALFCTGAFVAVVAYFKQSPIPTK